MPLAVALITALKRFEMLRSLTRSELGLMQNEKLRRHGTSVGKMHLGVRSHRRPKLALMQLKFKGNDELTRWRNAANKMRTLLSELVKIALTPSKPQNRSFSHQLGQIENAYP
jgi:hypothetical protein